MAINLGQSDRLMDSALAVVSVITLPRISPARSALDAGLHLDTIWDAEC